MRWHKWVQYSGGATLPGGAELWLPNDVSQITLASGAVSQWNDVSGNARHATQGTAANRPLLTTNLAALNQRMAVQFDGSNDFLAGALGIASGAQCTMFAIIVLLSSGTQTAGFLDTTTVAGTTNTCNMLLQNGNERLFRTPGGQGGSGGVLYNTSGAPEVGQGRMVLATRTKAGANDPIAIFDLTPGLGAPRNTNVANVAVPTPTQYRIGRLFQDVFPLNGYIAEIAYWSFPFTTAQVAQTQRYSASRYQIVAAP